MNRSNTIFVYADWKGLREPVHVGTIHSNIVRGDEVLSFEYTPEWLKNGKPIMLDPRLHFAGGRQHADTSRPFGLLTDSAPDRWGRLLIRRRAALESDGPRAPLFESDYLLAVSDTCRMGALRFYTDPKSPFLAEDTELSVPPLHRLRELEEASRLLEETDLEDPEQAKWLNLLFAPGSSLGGARPKCSVIDPEGLLWIAKFPSRSDEYDVGAWEGVIHQLARAAGLRIPHARTERFSNLGHTFLTQRFDREKHLRIHFASAMNLLGYQDGAGARTGVSYLELVDLIENFGANVADDLEELWRRIVFNVLVNNTDDHLRNHGFLLTAQGWKLSPAYDLNALPWKGGLALNIDEDRNDCDLDLVQSVGPYFRLSSHRQRTIIKEVSQAVITWEKQAGNLEIGSDEIEMLRPAFQRAHIRL